MAGNGGGLPYDANVAYLESTGTQYINTNIIPDGTTEAEITFQYTTSTNSVILGGRYSNQNRKFTIGKGSNGFFAALGSQGNVTFLPYDTNIHTAVLKATTGKASFDGGSELSVGTIASSNFRIYLFACNQNNSASIFASARIMSVKIGTLMELIPVRVGQTGYMYDKVSGQLFGNSGTGNFILGNDVN